MTIHYIDSSWAGAAGAAHTPAGGFGAGLVWQNANASWSSLTDGDTVAFRCGYVFAAISGGFFTNLGVNGKRLVIRHYSSASDAAGGLPLDGLPLLDMRQYSTSDSEWTSIGSGKWQKAVSLGTGAARSDCMWIGASTPSSGLSYLWVEGTMVRKALNLVDVTGSTSFWTDSNAGIWFDELSGTTLTITVWTGSDTRGPIATYGGLAFMYGGNSSGSRMGINFLGAGASDSEVHEVAVYGGRVHGMGSMQHASNPGTVNNVLLDGIRAFACRSHVKLDSQNAGSLITNWELSGDWVTDDRIDPVHAPTLVTTDGVDMNDWEHLSLVRRCRDVTVSDGTCNAHGGHGAVSVASGVGDGGEDRSLRCTINGTRVVGDTRARDLRGLAIQGWDDVALQLVRVTGCSTRSQIAGTRTVLTGCEFYDLGVAQNDNTQQIAPVFITNAIEAGTMSVSIFHTYIDRRGIVDAGATKAWAAINIRAASGKPVAAGAITIENNVFLLDPGMCGVRTSDATGSLIDTNQTIRNNTAASSDGLHTECYAYVGGDSTGNTDPGTATTVAGKFTTGATTGNANRTHLAAFARADRPLTRRGFAARDRIF